MMAGKGLVVLVMLSQLAACNFLDNATGLVGDERRGADDSVEASVNRNETGNGSGQNVSTTEQVTGAGQGDVSVSATLSWTAPAAREDQSALSLSEIAGFRIYYSATQGLYEQYIEVNSVYTDELSLHNLGLVTGTYYIVMTTIDSNGRESVYSDVVVLEV